MGKWEATPPGHKNLEFGPVTNAISNFIGNYINMRQANTIGADKYFHCMANCEAARQGPVGVGLSRVISETREITDEYIKGDSAEACNADRDANGTGRDGGKNKLNVPCPIVCKDYRPNGLPPKY